jgi:hypothetical protein
MRRVHFNGFDCFFIPYIWKVMFLIFLIFRNSLDDFNQASYDLVKGLKEISNNRITNEVLKLQIQV